MKKAQLCDKDVLNPEEAVVYFDLSRRKFNRLLRSNTKSSFIVMYKSRRLIIRTEFEKYLQDNPKLKEELANGKKNRTKA